MADPHDLATLDQAKKYLSPTISGQAADQQISQLLTAVSKGIAFYCSRIFVSQTITELRHGNSRESMRTKNYPIIQVQSVQINGMTVNQSTGVTSPGWVNDYEYLYIRGSVPGGAGGLYSGCRFPKGVLNVSIIYSFGFLTPGQIVIQNLPSWQNGVHYTVPQQILQGGYIYTCISPGISGASTPTFTTTLGAEITDSNVVWQNAGAWAAPPANAFDLPEQLTTAACIQTAYMYAMRPRIGDSSTGEAQQRVTYIMRDWHPSVKDKIDPFKAVVPIGNYS